MKNLPTLRDDSSFAVQFSISVSKTRAILLFKIKIKLIDMFELTERMPLMRSAEYQATIRLKFFIIIHYTGFRVVSDVTGRHFRRCWEEKTTRSNVVVIFIIFFCGREVRASIFLSNYWMSVICLVKLRIITKNRAKNDINSVRGLNDKQIKQRLI